ncbi:hypothetical protein J6590_093966 [Homalodisca vitripennis]|nr:hypothetical protein J6590_093966 [Homalodisca vitripennis]
MSCFTRRSKDYEALSNTYPGEYWLKDDFRTTTNGLAGGLLARTGSLSAHPFKQQPRSTILHPVILRYGTDEITLKL